MSHADPSEVASGRASGGILAGTKLLYTLKRPNYIFRDGSWDSGQIKGAGYELRLARDFLVVPTGPGEATFRTIRKDHPGLDEIILAPGDSALISTQEKFCLDFSISVLIGPKFRWSARGLLILHGMVAHPGYGRELDSAGEWIPKEDERLYLIVANIGPKSITMRRGDPIAYVQFFEVDPPAAKDRRQIDNIGFDYLRYELFEPHADSAQPGLAYFRNVRDLRTSIQLLNERVKSAENSIDRVRSVTDNVVVFGVFLVGATILGVVLTTLISLIESAPEHLSPGRVTLIAILSSLYSLSALIGVILVGNATRKFGRAKSTASDPRSPTP